MFTFHVRGRLDLLTIDGVRAVVRCRGHRFASSLHDSVFFFFCFLFFFGEERLSPSEYPRIIRCWVDMVWRRFGEPSTT